VKIIKWIVGLTVFVLLVAFAVRNADDVVLRTFLGHEWRAPLVLVLLVFFVGGVAVGLLVPLGTLFRLRREVTQFRKAQDSQLAAADEDPARGGLSGPVR